MTTSIHFGTDGWRGLIADDFTFANVARCSQGLANYLKVRGTAAQGLVVGYDTRFLSPEFAQTVARVCAGNGVRVYLSSKPAPTPVFSFNVLHHRAAGAAIITASHNAAVWNGFKFKPEYAGTASQEITDQLEVEIKAVGAHGRAPLQLTSLEQGRNQGLIIDIDPDPPYLERIKALVDLKAIQDAGLAVVVDAMFGAGAGYIPALVLGDTPASLALKGQSSTSHGALGLQAEARRVGQTTIEEMHGYRNPAFPGMEQPEPIAHNLTSLSERIQAGGVSVGLALDGDADRLGVMDERGQFITTLQVFSLLALYLLENKGLRGPLVKGVTASMMLNKLGRKFGVAVHEMQVGFKYIGPKMTEVNALMGGEESGGFAFRGHVPERDGILSGLFILEYLSRTGKSPSQLLAHLFDQVGPHYYHRRDVSFKPEDRGRIQQRLQSSRLTQLAGMPVRQSDEIDGRRLIFDNAWLASRFSGTEPLLRIYAEADSPEKVTALLDTAAQYLGVGAGTNPQITQISQRCS